MSRTPPRLFGRRRFRNRNGRKKIHKKGCRMPSKQKSTSLPLQLPPSKIKAHEQSICILEIFLLAPITPTRLCAQDGRHVRCSSSTRDRCCGQACILRAVQEACVGQIFSHFEGCCVHTFFVLVSSVAAQDNFIDAPEHQLSFVSEAFCRIY